jgi:cyanophycin synthetase
MGRTAFSVHYGPSIYSHRPVIRYTLEVSPSRNPAPVRRSPAEGLFALLPGLREHRAPCDVRSLLERENGDAGASLIPHVFEHVCIELQNQTGAELGCVRPRGGRIDPGDAVIPYDDESVALEAGRLSLDLIESLLHTDSPPDFDRQLREFLKFSERQKLPVQDVALVRAAEARDIPVMRITGRYFQLGHGRHQQRVSGTQTTHTNVVSNDLAANKDYARRVFRAFGLPVPAWERVQRKEDAVAAAERIGFPVVVKPNRSKMGIGVSVGMKTAREVRKAFDRTHGFSRSVLIEQYVAGADTACS